jgi:hypothetical protein
MELSERRAKTQELGIAIAKHLPEGWKFRRDPDIDNQDRAYFVKGAMRMALTIDDWHQKTPRVRIQTWDWPKYTKWEHGYRSDDSDGSRSETVFPSSLYDPKEGSPDITVSMEKSPEQIAKDITRRFIPEYERIFTRCQIKADQFGAFEAASKEAWEDVMRQTGGNPRYGSHYHDIDLGDGQKVHLSLEHRGESVHVETTITPAQFKLLLAGFAEVAKS